MWDETWDPDFGRREAPAPKHSAELCGTHVAEPSGTSPPKSSPQWRSADGWRRERDSNPRRAFDPYTLSRGAPSTTRPSLRGGLKVRWIRDLQRPAVPRGPP